MTVSERASERRHLVANTVAAWRLAQATLRRPGVAPELRERAERLSSEAAAALVGMGVSVPDE